MIDVYLVDNPMFEKDVMLTKDCYGIVENANAIMSVDDDDPEAADQLKVLLSGIFGEDAELNAFVDRIVDCISAKASIVESDGNVTIMAEIEDEVNVPPKCVDGASGSNAFLEKPVYVEYVTYTDGAQYTVHFGFDSACSPGKCMASFGEGWMSYALARMIAEDARLRGAASDDLGNKLACALHSALCGDVLDEVYSVMFYVKDGTVDSVAVIGKTNLEASWSRGE